MAQLRTGFDAQLCPLMLLLLERDPKPNWSRGHQVGQVLTPQHTTFFSVIQRRLKRHMKKLVWGIDGMIVTGENRITRRETCTSATLSTTNPPPTDLWSSTDLRSGVLKTNRQSCSAPQINFTRIAQPWAIRHYKPSGDGELLNERQALHPRRLGSINTTLREGQISHIGSMFPDAATRQISTVFVQFIFSQSFAVRHFKKVHWVSQNVMTQLRKQTIPSSRMWLL
jgi:hypothetical protein